MRHEATQGLDGSEQLDIGDVSLLLLLPEEPGSRNLAAPCRTLAGHTQYVQLGSPGWCL